MRILHALCSGVSVLLFWEEVSMLLSVLRYSQNKVVLEVLAMNFYQ
jgi:hypothetical protein